MPRLSHNTLESSADQNGHTQRLCIQPRSSKSWSTLVTYKAWCHSYNRHTDPRHEQTVLAKFPSHCPATKAWAKREQQRAMEVEEKALKFNTMLKYTSGLAQSSDQSDCNDVDSAGSSNKVTVLQPQAVMLDSVSFLDQKRREGEYLIFEDKLTNFRCFIDSEGRAVTSFKNSSGSRRSSTKRKSFKGKRSRSESLSDNRCDCHGVQTEETSSAAAQILDNLSGISISNNHDPSSSCPDDRPPTYEESQAAVLFGTHATGNHTFVPCSYHNSLVQLSLEDHHQLAYPQEGIFSHQSHSPPSTCPEEAPGSFVPHSCRIRSESETSNFSVDGNHDDNNGDNQEVSHQVLHAFVHSYYCHANGQSVIANLQGSYDANGGYVLTTPTVHSLSQSYGERDKGVAGMKKVIDNHRCSKFCRHLPNMKQMFDNLQLNANSRNLPAGA